MNLPAAETYTPCESMGNWWAKREDTAASFGPHYPSGSKMRQYVRMAGQYPHAPMIVGCSADSAMQVYVAAAAALMEARGIIYTAQRKQRSAATQYAINMGAEVNEVQAGYLSVLRARARDRAKELGECVRWQPALALADTEYQCGNIPMEARRIVVATGSGLTAAGIMRGLAKRGLMIPVLAVAVSPMATVDHIITTAKRDYEGDLPPLTLTEPLMPYTKAVEAYLPDGTRLDPFYAAKALEWVKKGDVFWIPGTRGTAAMPAAKRKKQDG